MGLFGLLPIFKYVPKDDNPPPERYFEMAFGSDMHAVFVLLIVDLGYAANREQLDGMYGHDLRPGSLTRAIKEGYIQLNRNNTLEVTERGREKLASMRRAGELCKGK